MFLRRILIFITAFFVFAPIARAQNEIDVQIAVADDASVIVTGKTASAKRSWRFADAVANATNLNSRIERFELFDQIGNAIQSNKNQAGEFESETAASGWRARIQLAFPKRAAESAHVSWLDKKNGVLMLADLLPEFAGENGETMRAKIRFDLPANWRIASSEPRTNENQFVAANYQKAVFMIGDLQEIVVNSGKTAIGVARTNSDWSFSEAEAAEIARKILLEYTEIFGSLPIGKVQILLAPLPQNFGGESWAAETRGSTVFVVSAISNFKSRALAKLHEQLRHELFHLWIPNNLNLIGDYAWFYEGFAIYQALKTGVKLKFIRFQDFLDTLSRARDAAQRSPQNKVVNLIEASRLRFAVDNSEFVYAKGMIVAFLCDVALLDDSNGKKSVTDVFKLLFERHRQPNQPQTANSAVLNVLNGEPETRKIIQTFVETVGEVDWQPILAQAGLQNAARTSLTRLTVAGKLSGRQRKILSKLGRETIDN